MPFPENTPQFVAALNPHQRTRVLSVAQNLGRSLQQLRGIYVRSNNLAQMERTRIALEHLQQLMETRVAPMSFEYGRLEQLESDAWSRAIPDALELAAMCLLGVEHWYVPSTFLPMATRVSREVLAAYEWSAYGFVRSAWIRETLAVKALLATARFIEDTEQAGMVAEDVTHRLAQLVDLAELEDLRCA